MSRVTILDLVSDYKDADIDMSTCKKSRDIQVIPRKMVEMIIERCEKIYQESNSLEGSLEHNITRTTIQATCLVIRKYAESLLAKFEEDKK